MKLSDKNEICHTCKKCNMSFNNKALLSKHKKTNYHCPTCGKYFKQLSSHKKHIIKFHNQTSPGKNNLILKKQVKSTNKNNWLKNDVFDHFERELPLELRIDEYRCKVCNEISENSTEYTEHEKTHYQIPSTINNGKRLKNPQETSTSQNNNMVVPDTQGDDASRKITSVLIEQNIKKVEQLLDKNKVNTQLVEKPQEAHTNSIISQQLDEGQILTNTKPRLYNKLHTRWGKTRDPKFRVYRCYVCFKKFTEEEAIRLHEIDHIKKNIC